MLIELPDPAELWRERGFDVDSDGRFQVGAIGLQSGAARLALRAPLEEGAAGLPVGGDTDPSGPSEHPNGAFEVDHLVVLTPDLERTSRELAEAGSDLRRTMGRLHFHRVGSLIVEIAHVAEEPAPRFWGLTFTAEDLPTGEGYGDPRDAVQPGRRIVTARGGTTAVAFITPRPPRATDANRDAPG